MGVPVSRLLLAALTLAVAAVLSLAPPATAAVTVTGHLASAHPHYIAEGTVYVMNGAGEYVTEAPIGFGDFELSLEPDTYTFEFIGADAEGADLTSVFTLRDVVIAGALEQWQVPMPATTTATIAAEDLAGNPPLVRTLTCAVIGPQGYQERYLRTVSATDTTPVHGFIVPGDAPAGSGCEASATFEDHVVGSEDVTLSAGGPNAFTVDYPDQVTVSGQITTPAGAATDGRVNVYNSRGYEVRSVEADPAGDYRVYLPPGSYEFQFQDRGRGMKVWAHDVYVAGDMTLDSPETWFPVTVHAVDSGTDTPTPAGRLELNCQDLVGIVGGGDDFEGLYQEASLVTTAPIPAVGGTATLHGMEIEEWACSLNLVQGDEGEEVRTELGNTSLRDGLRDLTYDVATGTATEGAPAGDDDGVPDAVEGQAPNNGDGNGDGTPDNEQAHVTSLPANGAAGGAEYVTVAAPAGVTLADVSTMDAAAAAAAPPAGVTLPSGLVAFVLDGVASGSTHTVSLFMGSTEGVNGYAKYDVGTDTWALLPDARVDIQSDHVDITLTDGGVGDDDGIANGQIRDPGGFAIVPVQGDTDPPEVTGSPTTSPNANGWYRSNVQIDWSATDTGSGVATQPADTVVTSQGSDVTALSPEVCDTAPTPNCATGSVTGLRIDKTAPSLSITGVTDGATYVLGAAPTPSCTASDTLSGLSGPCSGLRVGGNRNGVGSFTYVATVVDKAGNRRVVSADYRVVYRVDGFAAPLNNPPASTSVFRSGVTIPVAFSLRRADGQVVTPLTRPVWVTPVRGSRTTLPVNESASSGHGTTGSSFVWRNSRWEYAWSTRGVSAGYLYRIGVRLDDGTTRYLTVGLR